MTDHCRCDQCETLRRKYRATLDAARERPSALDAGALKLAWHEEFGNTCDHSLQRILARLAEPDAGDVELPANMALNPYIHGHVDVLTTAPGRPHALDVEALAGAMHDEYEGIGHPDAACWPWPGCPAAISWRERATAILARLTEPDAGEGTCSCESRAWGHDPGCPRHTATLSLTRDTTSGIYDDPDDLDCTWCGGEGFSECDDPLGCPGPHIGSSAMAGGECPCRPCGGTGLRSKQTVF